MIVDLNEDTKYYTSILLAHGFDFKGKKFLDVGCGYGRMVKWIGDTYHPEIIIGIDKREDYIERGENYHCIKGDARDLDIEDNTFDYVYSISTFEHINGVARALSEIRRVLKPRGKFLAFFAPIWTSVVGHHCFSAGEVIRPGMSIDEKVVFGIPAWGHLYMNKDEMGFHLSHNDFDDAFVKRIVTYMYDTNDINRRTASETRNDIMNSGMLVRSYNESVTFSRMWAMRSTGSSELTPDIRAIS